MSKWSIFALCIIAAVGLWFYNNGACPLQAMSPSSDTASSGSYQQITASQVKERLDKGDKITVIDVRTPDEYAAGHIPGSLLIPFDEIKVNSDQLPLNNNTEIVVYCRSTIRSSISGYTLISLGFANISDLRAIITWTHGLDK